MWNIGQFYAWSGQFTPLLLLLALQARAHRQQLLQLMPELRNPPANGK